MKQARCLQRSQWLLYVPNRHLDDTLLGIATNEMCQIFTRNKMLGWTSVMFALQQWMAETPSQRSKSGTPAIFQVGMALLSVVIVRTLPWNQFNRAEVL